MEYHRKNSLLIGIVSAVFLIILARNAWLCDDAYITLRTVDNFINGYGLTWNVAERVQTYTHPLWMFLLSAFYLVTGEAYYTTVILSMTLSLLAVVLFAHRVALSTWSAVLAVCVLTVSKAFMDFSTSGLENPLTHLIMVVFFIIYFEPKPLAKSVFWMSLCAAMGILNRADTVLIFLPPLLYIIWKVGGWRPVRAFLAGMIPVVVWEAFSLFYYGFLFPNTAYAKLGTGIGTGDLANRGLVYLFDAVLMSPITPVTIVIAIAVSIVSRKMQSFAMAIGLSLYLAYIVRIGGDFMTGRFLATPLFVSVILLSRFEFSRLRWRPLTFGAALILVGVLWPLSPVFSGSGMGKGDEKYYWHRGIRDERASTFQYTGLLNGSGSIENYQWYIEARQAVQTRPAVVVRGGIGVFGYYVGPEVHVLDKHALGDPLLARLPAWMPSRWLPGHYRRWVPYGYISTLETGENQIEDPDLAAYYEGLRIVVRGRLTSWERLKEIIRFNLGYYSDLIGAYAARPSIRLKYDRVNKRVPQGTNAFLAKRCYLLPPSGIQIDFDTVRRASVLEIGRDHNDDYLLRYFRQEEEIASQMVPSRWRLGGGTIIDIVEIPEHAAMEGFDRIVITGQVRDDVCAFSHLKLLNLKPDEIIRELLRLEIPSKVELHPEQNLAVDGWSFGDTIILRALYAVPEADSIHFLFAYEARNEVDTNYKIFFHVDTTGEEEKFFNHDFPPPSNTGSWKKGSVHRCRITTPNYGDHFYISTGFFLGNKSLGQTFNAAHRKSDGE
ncbi:MAG: hypothetical protein JSU74_13270 [Candidatus Zixiibacteriota bacterium]|nr:MAG: hypothetical protein JSU74_13270 [candidate division Zixibacteria bacterium]